MRQDAQCQRSKRSSPRSTSDQKRQYKEGWDICAMVSYWSRNGGYLECSQWMDCYPRMRKGSASSVQYLYQSIASIFLRLVGTPRDITFYLAHLHLFLGNLSRKACCLIWGFQTCWSDNWNRYFFSLKILALQTAASCFTTCLTITTAYGHSTCNRPSTWFSSNPKLLLPWDQPFPWLTWFMAFTSLLAYCLLYSMNHEYNSFCFLRVTQWTSGRSALHLKIHARTCTPSLACFLVLPLHFLVPEPSADDTVFFRYDTRIDGNKFSMPIEQRIHSTISRSQLFLSGIRALFAFHCLRLGLWNINISTIFNLLYSAESTFDGDYRSRRLYKSQLIMLHC